MQIRKSKYQLSKFYVVLLCNQQQLVYSGWDGFMSIHMLLSCFEFGFFSTDNFESKRLVKDNTTFRLSSNNPR